MRRHHLVRLGALGHVGRFTAVDAATYPRGKRVVLRTARGLEIGEVLGPADDAPTPGQSDGSILRGMTVEDQLLEARLEKNRQAAFDACIAKIQELGISATLVDVEHLFDGRSLFFYFLGDVPPELESLAGELAETYDSAAEIGRFADTLTAGCGPGCGTEEGGGGGCSTCTTGCAISGSCGVRKR
jgi:cell fate regulator YaaT (PSP1 superfamily)